MIIFDYRPPSPTLREYVRQFQIVGLSFGADAAIPVKPYWPRPENCLGFYTRGGDRVQLPNGLMEQWSTRSVVVGQHSYLLNRKPPNDFIYFQVVFQPGALYRLTGVPSHLLTNTLVDAEAIFSSEIRLVNERLSSTDNHLEMVEIVESFLVYLIRRQSTYHARNSLLPVDKVSQFLLAHPDRFSLDWLADQACLSTKQFYNLFVQRMGISPKLYARIARFDQAIKRQNMSSHTDWLTIALELGYYDYQHMVRDFKEFTQLTPSEFIEKERNAPERTFGNTET